MKLNLSNFAVSIFGPLADRSLSAFKFIEEPLKKADMMISLRSYVSLIFLLTVLSAVGVTVAVILLNIFLGLPPMFQIILYLIPAITPMITFAYASYYPTFRYLDKRKSIEANLPFALTHMASVAQSGIAPYIVFKLLSRFDEYGEVSKEMQKIVRNIEVFGMDPLSAMRSVAERTPSDSFKQVLLGLITTTESGGNVKTYLKNTGEEALFEWKTKREKFLQQLATYAEFYTGIVIAAPLFIVALFAVMALIQPNIAGFSIIDLTKLSIYLIVPGINIGFLWVLRTVEVEI